jgi:hypothetical protein
MQVPIARVDAACGTSAVTTSYSSGFGSDDGIDDCAYAAPGMTAYRLHRTCVPTAGDAQVYYQATYDSMPLFEFQRELVGGVGERAFMQTSANPLQADLYVLNGNLSFTWRTTSRRRRAARRGA